MFPKNKITVAVACALCTNFSAVAADTDSTDEKPHITAPVVVTATRSLENSFDLPVAIDVVNKSQIQDSQLQMTLSESLIRIPGITAQNRGQMAQDPQISSRGFGARSSFGVRGVRVYVDGIPLTYPDGSGQPGSVDLGVMRSVEVMRGPFSSLYGNSSGGVIQMLTEDVPASPEISVGTLFGKYDTRRQNARAAGTVEGMEYLINYADYDSDGYRDFSHNTKKQATAKFKFNLNEDTKLTTLVNWFDQKAHDPSGLTWAEVQEDRRQAAPNSLAARTRVARSQTQVGFNLEHTLSEHNSINLIAYAGTRRNLQYLSLGGANGRASGIDREFRGTDLRWNNNGDLLNRPYNLSLGWSYGKMEDDRSDIAAMNGIKTGVLNRDEDNIARNSDFYMQAKWAVLEQLDLHAGARRTKVTLEVDDHFTAGAGSNGDNSGRVSWKKTTPVVGAVWKATPTLNFYANYGKGFETPTFIEAAYSDTGPNPTPNLGLKASESYNYEIGTKAFIGTNTTANLTLFKIRTDDEIVVEDNNFGRSVYSNAGKTKRHGAELSFDTHFDNNVSLYGAYTLLSAKYDSTYTNNLGNTIRSGAYLPGTYKNQAYLEAAWKYEPLGFNTALEARYNSKVYTNDTNADSAHSYTIFNLRAGFTQNVEHWSFSQYALVENLFDKHYIGSVRVNDGNGRFYEPASNRSWLLGLNANYRF